MIVVTGATGQYGRLVVEALLNRGTPASDIAVAVRTPARAADLAARGVAVREADYSRPETLTSAFAGADKLVFVSSSGPDEVRRAQHANVVAAAVEARVGLILYTSIHDAPNIPMRLAQIHRDTETAIAASGLPSVLLRNGWYTENHTADLAAAVERGSIASAAGTGRIASAARADYAEAAAVVLSRDDQAGKIYELTGDTTWNLPELAALAATESARPVTYTPMPEAAFAELLTTVGLPSYLALLLADSEARIAEGALSTTTSHLADLLGRPTTPVTDTVATALKG